MLLPTEPTIPNPVTLDLVERHRPTGNQLNLTFTIRGGADKMSLHVTPINGYFLKEWSFSPMDHETFGHRRTYFVFLTYGHEAPADRTFSILLENVRQKLLVQTTAIISEEPESTGRRVLAKHRNGGCHSLCAW